jgi:hypothetical protein
MTAVREFRVRPETATALDEFREAYNDLGYFSRYGLDATLGVDEPDWWQRNLPSWISSGTSRVGCGSYIGMLTEAAGVMANSEVMAYWGVDRQMPIANLTGWPPVSTGLPRGVLNALTVYGTVHNILLAAFNKFASQAPQWGQAPCRQMKFIDPGLMAKWIDSQNENTHWTKETYKDRGVDIRYDVPEKSNLDSWRREP